jgi:hypothetical protein
MSNSFSFILFTVFCIFYIFYIFYIFAVDLTRSISTSDLLHLPQPLPKAKKNSDIKEGEKGALAGDGYDLMLFHSTIGHMDCVDGALPGFPDGIKALDFIFCRKRKA